MAVIQGKDRFQLSFSSLECAIQPDNEVRFIDAFVNKLDLMQLGIQSLSLNQNNKKAEGRSNYSDALFLKLYLYAYLNGIRSCRAMEREAIRNIELQWLLNGLAPNYHSIADFRKINAKGLKNLFKLYVLFLKDANLIGASTIAIDGTKIRGNNSKKNNYNAKKVERHLAYIEEKSNEFLQQLEENDTKENSTKITKIEEKINQLKTQKIKYEQLQSQIENSIDPQVSTTDADARALLVRGQVVEVGYNVQAAVDDKHNLVVATHTINRNDKNALYNIASEAQNNLNEKEFTVLADKGYHTGKEIQACQDAGITTIVAQAELVSTNEKGTQKAYLVTHFIYNKEADTYTCPQGNILHTTGKWHKKSRELNVSYQFKKYRTDKCKTCPVQHLCTGRHDGRREIERSEYAESVAKNKQNYETNKALYRKRQEINEHVFGTIKRQWNLYYTNLRGLEKVNGEWSLIMTVYNIKRSKNILGFENLMEKLANWTPKYQTPSLFIKIRFVLRPNKPFYFLQQNMAA